MIKFLDHEHLCRTMAFAIEHRCADKLVERLDYLAHYADGNNMCEIYYDHAPNSFAFLMRHPDGRVWFNGGLIYSGPGQPLDGSAPAFTVSLEPTGHEHKWSVHT